MEMLKTERYSHDNEMEIAYKISTMELENWINHLKYRKKELINMISICSVELTDKLENDMVLQRFQKKQNENDTLLNALLKYMNLRGNIAICEYVLGDMVFITEQESYRRSYLYHLDKYRRLKIEFFNKLQGTFIY